jgi:hypothetical protein
MENEKWKMENQLVLQPLSFLATFAQALTIAKR